MNNTTGMFTRMCECGGEGGYCYIKSRIYHQQIKFNPLNISPNHVFTFFPSTIIIIGSSSITTFALVNPNDPGEHTCARPRPRPRPPIGGGQVDSIPTEARPAEPRIPAERTLGGVKLTLTRVYFDWRERSLFASTLQSVSFPCVVMVSSDR